MEEGNLAVDENKTQVFVELQNETELTEMISINVICRLCANQNDKLIGIYSEDGINNELAIKMNTYLPVKVTENDELPLQCCWQCASTVLAWHELVVTSIEADRRLRSYQFVIDTEIKITENSTEYESPSPKQNGNEADEVGLNAFCQTEHSEEIIIKKCDTPTCTDNLSEFVNMESRYITIDNDLYNIKSDQNPNDNSEKESSQKIFKDQEACDVKEADETCYGCHACQMVFANQDDMLAHIKEQHQTQTSKPRKRLKKERRKHNKIDEDLITPAKIIVDGEVLYNCKECGRCLHSPYTYVWHMRIHTGERPHKCELCGKQFRVSQGLVRHIKETHQGIKNFSCDLCGRMFASRRNVEEHRRIHTNERPYVCELCGKAFKQKASLFVHNRSHTDSFPFKCSYCNQMFRTKPPLLIHITKHTGEKPYPCDICGRHFRIKYELKRHKLIHSDDKPFSCDTCGLSFKQKRYLRNHNKLKHNVLNTT